MPSALGVVLGRLEARHGRCSPLAGRSTLNRLEHGATGADRYRRIAHDGAGIEALFGGQGRVRGYAVGVVSSLPQLQAILRERELAGAIEPVPARLGNVVLPYRAE